MPVIIGTVAASDSIATTALSLSIERTLSQVGNVSGRISENSNASSTVSTTSP